MADPKVWAFYKLPPLLGAPEWAQQSPPNIADPCIIRKNQWIVLRWLCITSHFELRHKNACVKCSDIWPPYLFGWPETQICTMNATNYPLITYFERILYTNNTNRPFEIIICILSCILSESYRESAFGWAFNTQISLESCSIHTSLENGILYHICTTQNHIWMTIW